MPSLPAAGWTDAHTGHLAVTAHTGCEGLSSGGSAEFDRTRMGSEGVMSG